MTLSRKHAAVASQIAAYYSFIYPKIAQFSHFVELFNLKHHFGASGSRARCTSRIRGMIADRISLALYASAVRLLSMLLCDVVIFNIIKWNQTVEFQ